MSNNGSNSTSSSVTERLDNSTAATNFEGTNTDNAIHDPRRRDPGTNAAFLPSGVSNAFHSPDGESPGKKLIVVEAKLDR